jgi:hypothetical protein
MFEFSDFAVAAEPNESAWQPALTASRGKLPYGIV